jgi:hypothetical protein
VVESVVVDSSDSVEDRVVRVRVDVGVVSSSEVDEVVWLVRVRLEVVDSSLLVSVGREKDVSSPSVGVATTS